MGTHKTQFGPIIANVPVTVLASALIWALAIYCMAEPEAAKTDLGAAKSSVTDWFTWAYISSNGIWFFFIIWIYYKYGNVKLGKDDDKPEFDDANYFVMIFCAGIAIGLFFYGASEPMYHYIESTGANRYSGAGYLNDNEKAQWAINVTLYHWGVHAWVVYSVTAITLGILSYRYGLPLTYRTCFFPIFGKVTWGWIGDLIDSCTIAGCIAGVCTSLGLGAQQIITGMQHIGILKASCPTEDELAANVTRLLSDGEDCLSESGLTNSRVILIAIITCMATISVISGLETGIKLLSQIAFSSGMVLWCIVFVLDDTWYFLNLMVQSFGFYIQWIIQIGWFTDAFAQLRWGEGQALDSYSSDPSVAAKGADPAWMDWWTIFYWGWWIAWSPFVGVFLARISKGRTIKEVINFTFSIPLIYCIMWFSVFGGAAIRMHRKAELLALAGEELYGDADKFLSSSSANCYDVPEKLADCPEKPKDGWAKGAKWPQKCPEYAEKYATDVQLSPVCKFDSKHASNYWFDLMEQYYSLGSLLSGFSIFTIMVYFVTSSDSGSLVVDYIASNGEEAHWSQRVYWAFTEGGLAIALLLSGGSDSLGALQAVSIITGVPLTIFVCFICMSLWVTLKCETGEFYADQYTTWAMPLYGGIFDYLEFLFSMGRSSLPDVKHGPGFLISLFFPPAILFSSCQRVPSMSSVYKLLLPAFALVFWVGFLFSMIARYAAPKVGFQGFEFFFFCAFATCVVALRYEVRNLYNIEGSGLRDALASFFTYPQAVWQVYVQVTEVEAPKQAIKQVEEPTAGNSSE